MKTAYIVLGAQRSGTSATSHLLSRFGIDFGNPDRFIQFGHNPIFFELKWVNDYNNRVIQAFNHQYIDFFLPTETDFQTEKIRQLESELESLLQSEWNDTAIIGVKDPRISLTFPVWENVLLHNGYQIKVVLAFRRPANFLRSNQRLFNNWEGWTEERHLNFWLQLNLAAIYFCRNQPLYFLNYDRLIRDPLPETIRLAEFFSLDSTQAAEAAAVIQPTQAHHQIEQDTQHSFVDRCYQLLCEQALTPAEYWQFRNLTGAEQGAERNSLGTEAC